MESYVTWIYNDSGLSQSGAKFLDIISIVGSVLACAIGVGFYLLYLRYKVHQYKVMNNKKQVNSVKLLLEESRFLQKAELKDYHLDDSKQKLGNNFTLFYEKRCPVVSGYDFKGRFYIALAVKETQTNRFVTGLLNQEYRDEMPIYSRLDPPWCGSGVLECEMGSWLIEDGIGSKVLVELASILNGAHPQYQLLTEDEITRLVA